MPRSLQSVLSQIPGYAGYTAAQDRNRAAETQELQQASGLMAIIGQQQERQAKQAALQRDEQMRSVLANSGGDVNAAMKALITSGNPQGAASLAQILNAQKPTVVGPESSLVSPTGQPVYTNPAQRPNAGTQTERALKGLMTLQRKSAAAPLTEDEEMDAQVYRPVLSQERVVTDPVTNQQTRFTPLTIPDSISVGRPRTAPEGAEARPMPTAPGAPPQGSPRKPLDQADQKELQGFNDASKQIQGLMGGFQPTYGGWALDPIGNAALAVGRRAPAKVLERFKQEGLAEQATWWQNYYQWANDIRAAKFGLTLTGNELQAFERSTPKPSDDPEQIQTALQNQMAVLADKQRNRIGGLTTAGHNRAQIDATAGPVRQSFDTDEDALEAVRSGRAGSASVAIPKEVFRMPKNKEFNIGGLRLRGTLRADGNYYVTQGGKTFRVEE